MAAESIAQFPSLPAGQVASDDLLPIVDVSDLSSPTGTTKKTLVSSIQQSQNAFNSLFNVKSPVYGAVGNGITDDSTAIQAAINACSAAGGGIVWFPEGNYLILTGLVGHALVSLRGVMKGIQFNALEPTPGTYKGGVQIKAGAAMATMFSFVGSVLPEYANIVISDILFEGDNLAVGGVSFRKCNDVFLSRVQVSRVTTSPFVIGTAADTAAGMFWAYLDTCYANGTSAPATLFSVCGTQCFLSRCLSDDGGTAVAVVGGSSDILIETGRFENPTITGIAVGDFGFDLTVQDTTVLIGAASGIGIVIGQSQGLIAVDDCRVFGNGYASTTGIQIVNSGSGRSAMVTNSLVTNVATGIEGAAAYGTQITNNTVEVITSGFGLLLRSNAAEVVVANNRFLGIVGATGYYGINNQGTGKRVTFANNLTTGLIGGYYYPTTVYGDVAANAGLFSNTAYGGALSVTTSPVTLRSDTSVTSASWVMVSGDSGTAGFVDLVIFALNQNPVAITSQTIYGSPAVRTYSRSTRALQLAMASGTYTVTATALEALRT